MSPFLDGGGELGVVGYQRQQSNEISALAVHLQAPYKEVGKYAIAPFDVERLPGVP